MRANFHRSEGNHQQYKDSVDALISSLFRKERDVVKKLKVELARDIGYGLKDDLEMYYRLQECVVDTLEDAGFLTKELTIISSAVQLEPTGER